MRTTTPFGYGTQRLRRSSRANSATRPLCFHIEVVKRVKSRAFTNHQTFPTTACGTAHNLTQSFKRRFKGLLHFRLGRHETSKFGRRNGEARICSDRTRSTGSDPHYRPLIKFLTRVAKFNQTKKPITLIKTNCEHVPAVTHHSQRFTSISASGELLVHRRRENSMNTLTLKGLTSTTRKFW